LALQVLPVTAVLLEVAQAPHSLARALAALAELLIEVGQAYQHAGADFLTVHEMGGSPGVIGPRAFETLVLPPLQTLLSALPAPRVLSVCGRAGRALPLLAAAGAEALSVDQQTDLAQARAALGPNTLLFGNIDPVGVLANGSPTEIQQAVSHAIASGADAVWPGCDLWPATPRENMRALITP
jgi:[methyl-Co(III) methanol-specific corrinoid protein]:coenzyme M methyltransferase